MKLLMLNTKELGYKTFSKTIDAAEDNEKDETITDSAVVFIHVEKDDEARMDRIVEKAVGNITWLAKKLDRNRIVLHSFAHLSDSKSSPEFAEVVIKNIKEKLEYKDYKSFVTPFGYFLEFKIHVLGESLAKVFKAI